MLNWWSNDVLRPRIGKEGKAVLGKPFLFLGRRDGPAMCGSG